MNDTITTIYYLSDKFLKAIRHREDPQAHLSTAEVMSVPLVALTFFGANIDKARLLLKARMALRTVCEAHPRFLAILGGCSPRELASKIRRRITKASEERNLAFKVSRSSLESE